jgi:predicted nucleic acid-binding protein
LPLLTSEAVLTKVFYFVESKVGRDAVWHLVDSGAVALAAIDQVELPDLRKLMEKYADRPMDFVDATLVHVAEREQIFSVFTVDQADFSAYRLRGKKSFRLASVD